MASYQLVLTYKEMVHLLDSTSIFYPCPSTTPLDTMYIFRLKLLSGIREAAPTMSASVITLESYELWLSLETAKSPARMGTEEVGINLIKKLAEALLAVTADSDMQSVITQVGESDLEDGGPELSKQELQDKLDEYKHSGEKQ